MSNILIYAHRGASDVAPENTMAAFKMAKEVVADGIELDVHLTQDGQVVVAHDDTIDRTSNGKGHIGNFTLEELREFDFGSWKDKSFAGERIPLLNDVVKFIKENDMLLNIEIKPLLEFDEIVEKVVAICEAYDVVDRVVISSFDHYCLLKVKKVNKKMETAILYQSGIVDVGKYATKHVKADGIHPHKYAMIKQTVVSAVKHGLKIRPWTVDDVDLFKKFAGIKYITGVVTNCPEKMRKALDEV